MKVFLLILLRLGVLAVISFYHTNGFAQSLSVSGWLPANQFSVEQRPPQWLGDDPILGRLGCPSLTRLDLESNQNMPLLLKTHPVVEAAGAGQRWLLQLRPGLKWWSGEAVKSDHLVLWLKDNLKNILEEKLGILLESLPTVERSDALSVMITWPKVPEFGPYIFSGSSFYRSTDKKGYECVGLYAIHQESGRIQLVLNSGYNAKFKRIELQQRKEPAGKQKSNASIDFKLGREVSQVGQTSVENSCKTRLDSPIFTGIIWNPESPLLASAELRQAMTQATPRGEILRTALGDLGTLVSAPLLRSHPGYNSKNLVRSFQLPIANEVLTKNGLTQAHIGSPRKSKDGGPLQLRIGRQTDHAGLIEKILEDSFASLGIKLEFTSELSKGGLDGVFTTVLLPWPALDFVRGSYEGFPFKPYNDKSLAAASRSYSIELTKQRPNFSNLRHVHDLWYEQEPWTTLVAHQVCVMGRGVSIPARMSMMDGDWFRNLIGL